MLLFVTRCHAVAIGVGQEDLIDLEVLAVHPNAVQRITDFRIDRYLAGERLLRGIDPELETIVDRYDRVAQAAHRRVGLRAAGEEEHGEQGGQEPHPFGLFHSYSLFMCSSASGFALRDSSVIADYPHLRSWM